MLTELDDDALSRELGTAFHATTADVRYAGRRKPPLQPVAALPALGAVATIGAIVMVATQSGTSSPGHAPAPGGHAPQITTHSPGVTPAHGRQTIKLAGFEISYQAAANGQVGEVVLTLGPLPNRPSHSIALTVRVVDAVPTDAQKVPVPGSEAQAWVGTVPATGDNGLYLEAPTREGGHLFVVSGPSWTTDELANLVRNGSPFRSQ